MKGLLYLKITDKKKLDFIFFNSDFYSKNNINYIKNTKIINIDLKINFYFQKIIIILNMINY